MKRFPIENEQVKIIYDRLWEGFSNEGLSVEARLGFFKRIQLVETLVAVYEGEALLHEEDIDDLFIKYDEKLRPLFPEEMKKWQEKLSKGKQ